MSVRSRTLALVALALLPAASCVSGGDGPEGVSTRFEGAISELEVQALVMQMADDYAAVLGETTYLVLREADFDPKSRWLALSFLRNGMGAALDIAAGPNPDVALLDLLVLGSLQTWAFAEHWIPEGIDEQVGAAAVARLRAAEAGMWEASRRLLSAGQERTLRGLIDGWIAEHPDKTVVSFVRFDEFTGERELSTAGTSDNASGLLRDVGEATEAVEDARLFGERALWFAARYPYILGQQSELTAYRIADQPEVREAREALTALAGWIGQLGDEQRSFFERVREERALAIQDASDSLTGVLATAVDDLAARAQEARRDAVDHFFTRFEDERAILLEAFDAREGALDGRLSEARETALACAEAARGMTEAAAAFDRLVARFDREPEEGREPLRLSELRATAAEANLAAVQLNALFARLEEIASSEELGRGVTAADNAADELVDALFWRGAALIALLVFGLALVRRLPARPREA